ncbi:MAG: GNAT family N-acetyltransferase [Pyrinomonadaceae bacterium]|nr:GNAT family N-acetyltransferase [Phycisphaerales bacterium]
MSITLRQATPADTADILALVRELAEYEKCPDQAKATHEDLQRAMFGAPSASDRCAGVAECLMGEIDGRVQGIALYFMNFSSWTGKPGVYLEDLFVRPAARGSGLGKALLARLAKIAVDRGCPRLEWSVLNWNESAIGFYQSLGAKAMNEWTVYRLSGEALERMAKSSGAIS